jgi:hypothetical protein
MRIPKAPTRDRKYMFPLVPHRNQKKDLSDERHLQYDNYCLGLRDSPRA